MSFPDPDLCRTCGNQFPVTQECDECKERGMDDDLKQLRIVREAATEFLDRCSLEPTPDAVDQLAHAFLPALRIMCERGYDPNGGGWRESGWRGQLIEIRKRASRLWYNSWKLGRYDANNSVDMINYAGFYYRLGNEGEPWGDWGEPDVP